MNKALKLETVEYTQAADRLGEEAELSTIKKKIGIKKKFIC